MPNFLFEIFVEEVPQDILPITANFISQTLPQLLSEYGLTYNNIQYYTTPRRFAFLIEGLPCNGQDRILEQKGPSVKAAYDNEHNPSPALLGFFKSYGVTKDEIEEKEIKGQKYIFIQKIVKGEVLVDILPKILEKLITSIQFPQPMRWNYNNEIFEFIRPVRGITAMIDGAILPVQFFGILADNKIFGHRQFYPLPIILDFAENYEKLLTHNGCIPHYNQRKQQIQQSAQNLANTIEGTLLLDDDLLNTLSSLTEWPHCILAHFDKEFLELPKEVLISEMKIHQKYIPIIDNEQKLLPYYIITANIPVSDSETKNNILQGNNRVLKSRFADGQFFYSEDLKKGLNFYKNSLKSIAFVDGAGSISDKILRMQKIAEYLYKRLTPQLNKEDLYNAVDYAKADLSSLMVGEFPELQGIIGSYYALAIHLNPQVTLAIREHYYPMNDEGQTLIPSQELSAIVGLADRLDNLFTLYAVGKMVTGSKDPYALRRQVIAIINILIQFHWTEFSLEDLFYHMTPIYSNMIIQNKKIFLAQKSFSKNKDLSNEELIKSWQSLLTEFIKIRLEGILKSDGYPTDTLNASLNHIDFLINDIKKVTILQNIRMNNQQKFNQLIELFKRIKNILKDQKIQEFHESLLTEEAEKILYQKYCDIHKKMNELSYQEKLLELLELEQFISHFFTHIMVKTGDEKEINRLALLDKIFQLFFNQADFSKLS